MAKTNPTNAPALSKEERRKRQLAGLRPAQKGEVRNPEGKNGRTRAEYVAAWLEKEDPDDPQGRARIDIVLQREYEHTEQRSDACRALREAYAGKPKQQVDQQVDLSNSDGSMGGYPVVVQLPSNGRPMNEVEGEDQDASTEARSDGDGAENT